MFEILKSDLRGRIGTLHTNHGDIRTPAFVPVVHPAKQSIPPKKLKAMGFDLVITNAYITKNTHPDAAKKGIHKTIGFDGAVMTDSGGYQVLEYGSVSITPQEMAKFERDIRTDFAIPLDRPTGFDASRKKAAESVRHTLKVSRDALSGSIPDGQVWVGPIQGGRHTELVKRSAKSLVQSGFGMLALGSPVEFMESYEYGLLAGMIVAAKRHMPHSVPLHLFGAGHPLTVGFAAALGCDTFDSASYMLYARQGRYMTRDGTRYIKDIESFACSCEICSRYTPGELNLLEAREKADHIAIHNLYTIKDEVDATRQAIHEGRLWEYVIKKARAHPRLYEIVKVFENNADFFAPSTPRFKDRAIFLYDKTDQYRPELLHYRKLAAKFKSKKTELLITKESQTKPAYLSLEYRAIAGRPNAADIQVCQYSPHVGIIPLELSDMFPAAHHEAARTEFEPRDFPTFEDSLAGFFKNNRFSTVYYDRQDRFLSHFMKKIPKGIRKRQIKK